MLRNHLAVQQRYWVDHYVDDVMETGCGLHNFRLTHRAKQRSLSAAEFSPECNTLLEKISQGVLLLPLYVRQKLLQMT